MYHLTADSEVVFFFRPFMRHGLLIYWVWADAIAWILIWGGRYRNPGGLLGAHRDLLGVGEVWDCF